MHWKAAVIVEVYGEHAPAERTYQKSYADFGLEDEERPKFDDDDLIIQNWRP